MHRTDRKSKIFSLLISKVPTIPMNWGSMPTSSPVGQVSSNSSPTPYPSNMASPISIHTLDELAKQVQFMETPSCIIVKDISFGYSPKAK